MISKRRRTIWTLMSWWERVYRLWGLNLFFIEGTGMRGQNGSPKETGGLSLRPLVWWRKGEGWGCLRDRGGVEVGMGEWEVRNTKRTLPLWKWDTSQRWQETVAGMNDSCMPFTLSKSKWESFSLEVKVIKGFWNVSRRPAKSQGSAWMSELSRKRMLLWGTIACQQRGL